MSHAPVDNALLAALLAQAAAHRVKAETCRSYLSDRQWPRRESAAGLRDLRWPGPVFPGFDSLWERDAREQEGLADVYEGIAERVWRLQCGKAI